ncbi:MAG: energy transducer TonB [Candidatus Acidiferrales bacterium]
MLLRKIAGWSAALIFCAPFAFAQQSSPTQYMPAAPQAAATSAPAIPSYPDSPRGLEKLIKEMLRLEKSGETKGLAPYVQSLVLPNSDAWFRSTFGDSIGATLSGAYERQKIELPMSFPDTLADLLAKHHTETEAIRFTDSCNPLATEYEYPILTLRQNSQPLYDVRFVSGRTMTMIPYFAYVDGAFRYLGNFQVSGSWPIGHSQPHADSKSAKAIPVGGNVQAARLIHQVQPDYPAEAKLQGVQGTVLLHAIIGKDGAVHDLQLIQGHCWLAQAAIKAVSQWRYKPTLLVGNPVAVDTTISVIYNLGTPR